MAQAATLTRENRTITVDFHDETTYFQLLGDGKVFLECAFAFVLSLGFQLKHKATCRGGCLTRPQRMQVRSEPLELSVAHQMTCRVSSMLLKGVMRKKQASKICNAWLRNATVNHLKRASPNGNLVAPDIPCYDVSPSSLTAVVCKVRTHASSIGWERMGSRST